jgi:NhaA family Na+:H+ antiporter
MRMMAGKEPTNENSSQAPREISLPRARVEPLLRPLTRFLEIESASGVALILATLAAIYLANSAWAEAFAHFWEMPVSIRIGGYEFSEHLVGLVNDGLMTIFFFVVGLEIKREMVDGELRYFRTAILPIMAALGGMIAPAAIYLALRGGQPGQEGWGIPMATDIAFVVGILTILGPRVPLGLKVMLLSLAIADDIGAIVVIAIFYSSDISLNFLLAGGLGLLGVALLNWAGIRSIAVYVFAGIGIWFAFFESGIHPTVAGVILGLMTPTRAWISENTAMDVIENMLDWLRNDAEPADGHAQHAKLRPLRVAAREVTSPLERLEIPLHPWVAFLIMPIFALANAGVEFELSQLGDPVAIAVALGLVVGKPLGIVILSWLAVRVGLAGLMTGVNWSVMIGAGCLAGIGFTMSLFIAQLALSSEQLAAAKVGILTGSLASAILGAGLLLAFLPRPASGEAPSAD